MRERSALSGAHAPTPVWLREARVTFDDSIATVAALKKATSDIGYPALLSD